MKVHEILQEAISLTGEKGNAKKIIMNAIRKGMETVAFNLADDARNNRIENNEELKRRGQYYIHEVVGPAIQEDLWNYYWRNEAFSVRQIYFDEMRNRGEASGMNIRLNINFITEIEKILFNTIDESRGDKIFYDDGPDEQAIEHMTTQGYRYDIDKLDDVIDDLINTLIHELVHTQQHRTQLVRMSQGKGTEYRSYLTKDKQKFHDAIQQLATEYDFKIYQASPQEIPAFAHNMALQLIRIATLGTDIEDMNDIEDIQWVLRNLDDIIRDPRNYQRNEHFSRYQRFNDPANKQHYKVFKRFMKRVYQEVFSYIGQVQKKLEQVEYQKKRDKELDDWWDSEMNK